MTKCMYRLVQSELRVFLGRKSTHKLKICAKQDMHISYAKFLLLSTKIGCDFHEIFLTNYFFIYLEVNVIEPDI